MSAVAAVGVYVKTTVQLAPALSVALAQVPDLLNSAGAAGYDMLVAGALPTFDTVIVCGPLVLPRLTLPNESDVGEAVMFGALAAAPVPESEIDTLVPPLPVMVTFPL